MRTVVAASVAVFLILGVIFALGSRQELQAKADLVDAKGAVVGHATLTEDKGGVLIRAHFSRLSPGIHALHLHGTGECTAPDFKSAGGHFNPFGKKHGLKNPEGPHAGDLPNFEVKPDGTADIEVIASLVSLKPGKNSLLEGAGTCLVIHDKADDDQSDPAGNAGDRVACGRIQSR